MDDERVGGCRDKSYDFPVLQCDELFAGGMSLKKTKHLPFQH